MKRLSLLLIVVLAAMLIVPTPTYANVDLSRSQINGATAYAEFQYLQGVLQTFVSVAVNDSSVLTPPQQGGPAPVRFLEVSWFQVRTDTWEVTEIGAGVTDQFNFTVASDLSTAQVLAAFDGLNPYGSAVPVSINLAFQATGAVVDDSASFVYRDKGFLSLTNTRGFHRDAQATGSVLVGGVEFAGVPSSVAQIQNNKTGGLTVQIIK